MTTIQIRCAWHPRNFGCELILGEKDGAGATGVTHSICPACLAIEETEMKGEEITWE
jgi:hypothetical protein